LINCTISLFLPPSRRGPNFIFPDPKSTFGSLTLPTTKKCWTIFYEGILNIHFDSCSPTVSGTYSKTISAFFPLKINPFEDKHLNKGLFLRVSS